MFTKEYSDTQVKEKLEVLAYQPGLQDSGDLEAGTKTITATAEASGLGNATYTASLTLPKPADARLLVKRICARLQTTIDTIPSGDTNLYCRVYVDEQNAAHRLFDLDWTSTGAKLLALDTHSGALATVFDLLKDGASHTFYFFFWKAGTGLGITISLVRIWEGVGSSVVGAYSVVIQLTHAGFFTGFFDLMREGTGTPYLEVANGMDFIAALYLASSGHGTQSQISSALVNGQLSMSYRGSVNTDLNYFRAIRFVLRIMV